MKDFLEVVNKDELVLWQGKPHWRTWMAGKLLVAVTIWIVVAGLNFMFYSLIIGAQTYASEFERLLVLVVASSPTWAIGLVNMVMIVIYQMEYKRLYYVLTDKRVVIQSGIIGRDFVAVDHDKLSDVSVSVGLLDKIMLSNTGSITISMASGNGTGYSSFSHIVEPYKVFNFFKKTTYDVKSDLQYPNAYRPDVNPGYNTVYKPTVQEEAPDSHHE